MVKVDRSSEKRDILVDLGWRMAESFEQTSWPPIPACWPEVMGTATAVSAATATALPKGAMRSPDFGSVAMTGSAETDATGPPFEVVEEFCELH